MNYFNTFIAVASDTTARVGSAPPERGGKKTIAALEHELLAAEPYALTHEEVQFAVHVRRQGISAARLEAERTALWQAFFTKPMACMRTSPLSKSYGWGLHFNTEGKVALVPMESAEYQRLAGNQTIEQTRAMRSKRA